MALPDVIIVLAAAFTTALAALWWLSTNAGRPAAAPPGIDDMSLLFEDGELIHGSDSAESAQRELALFFSADEIQDYTRDVDAWLTAPDD